MAQEKLSNRKLWSVGLALAGLVGLIAGLGMFTFAHAKGYSYLSDDPAACVNCHVMRVQFDAWQHSSHSRVAACNDCHTPHSSVIAKYISKGINGMNHSLAFTFNTYGSVIQIRDYNADIVRENCIGCHTSTVSMIDTTHENGSDCISCHTGIGHRTRK